MSNYPVYNACLQQLIISTLRGLDMAAVLVSAVELANAPIRPCLGMGVDFSSCVKKGSNLEPEQHQLVYLMNRHARESPNAMPHGRPLTAHMITYRR